MKVFWKADGGASSTHIPENRKAFTDKPGQTRGLLRAMALVTDRGTVRCPLRLPANRLHARLRSGEPARSQALRRTATALSTACRGAPSGARPTTGACVPVRPAALGRRDQDSECLFRVGSVSSRLSDAVVQPRSCSGRRSPPANDRCRRAPTSRRDRRTTAY